MSRSSHWLRFYEEGLDQGLLPEAAAAFAINKEQDLLADYIDMKYQELKDRRHEH